MSKISTRTISSVCLAVTRTAAKLAVCAFLLVTASCGIQAQQPPLQADDLYRIQPGDELDIAFRITPDFNQTVTVQPDGRISLRASGSIKVSDQTLDTVTALIRDASSKLLHDPEVTVTLKDFQHPYFVVAGEVVKPGRFDLRENTTALQALLLAGGMKNTARSNQIIVYRRINKTDAEVKVLDLRTIKTKAGLEHDLMLRPGDMLLVPQNRFTSFERIVKLANLGVFFNPGNTL